VQISISKLEVTIHQLINVERVQIHLPLLVLDAILSNVARIHSDDMAKRNYFAHDTPEGIGPLGRCRRGGIRISETPGTGNIIHLGGAENIYQCTLAKSRHYINGIYSYSDYYTQEELAIKAVTGWMNSSGHKQNIVTPYWKQEGIGVGISVSGDVYVTQNFN